MVRLHQGEEPRWCDRRLSPALLQPVVEIGSSGIALETDEERPVELKREMVGGQERVAWNPALSIPAKEFEFTPAEAARIRAAVEAWDSYTASSDRRWLEPLLMVLFSGEVN
jgi:hypothetical protein